MIRLVALNDRQGADSMGPPQQFEKNMGSGNLIWCYVSTLLDDYTMHPHARSSITPRIVVWLLASSQAYLNDSISKISCYGPSVLPLLTWQPHLRGTGRFHAPYLDSHVCVTQKLPNLISRRTVHTFVSPWSSGRWWGILHGRSLCGLRTHLTLFPPSSRQSRRRP